MLDIAAVRLDHNLTTHVGTGGIAYCQKCERNGGHSLLGLLVSAEKFEFLFLSQYVIFIPPYASSDVYVRTLYPTACP